MRKKGIIISFFMLFYCALSAAQSNGFAVGPQYDTTHVYVSPVDFDRFVASVVSTFGGKTSKKGVFQVTPTSSQTMSQLVLTPVGTLSVFGFKTPIPYPFGSERTGYLVNDFDKAVAAAHAAGADILVTPFPDPIGRDAIIQWPGGISMQLYWHNAPPSYEPLKTIPENRVYLSSDSADRFIQQFIHFANGKVISDNPKASGADLGQPHSTYRRVAIESGFGKMVVLVTNGHLNWPYGRELTGYEVDNLKATLARATAAGVKILVAPAVSEQGSSAMIQFPGGYIAEVHETVAGNQGSN